MREFVCFHLMYKIQTKALSYSKYVSYLYVQNKEMRSNLLINASKTNYCLKITNQKLNIQEIV